MQLRIASLVWDKKKNVSEAEASIILVFIFFDPLNLCSLTTTNVGSLKDLLTYVCIEQFLT